MQSLLLLTITFSVTSKNCKHLIVDAGHIAIESQLANKKAVQEIIAKRKKQYSDEDYQRLESLMYDKLTVRLQAAQACNFTDKSFLHLKFLLVRHWN